MGISERHLEWVKIHSEQTEATMSTKTTEATNKVTASAPGRTATKLVATLTNGPALIGYARVSPPIRTPASNKPSCVMRGASSFEPRRYLARAETAAASLRPS